MNTKPHIIAVGGPTASGKSALALEIAELIGGEIVSCDSMQIYRGMDIGTAKPASTDTERVPHHMIDVCEPDVNYSAADWAGGAADAIRDIISRGKTPVICGGTGMYLDALLRPTSFEGTSPEDNENAAFRREMAEFAAHHGNEALHQRLREVDPDAADAIHMNNVKRVIRALEIFYTTGMTKTEADRLSQKGESPYECSVVTISYNDREILYDRINRRVDIMMEEGLLDEVKSLAGEGRLVNGTTASQAIGYKEMLLYLNGEVSLSDAVELIKKNTRNYAKRQITWFKRYGGITIIPDEASPMKTASQLAREVVLEIGK